MTAQSLTRSEFQQLQALIYDCTGIHFAPTKQEMLAGRLQRRLRMLRLDGFGAYLRYLANTGDELVQLLDCVTTNETRFFRERNQFDFLRTCVIPMWMRLAGDGARERTLRIWSAGCSTGEEPYSIAMLLLAVLSQQAALWDIEILATDLSTRALERAAQAVWPVEKASDIPRHLLHRFMLRGVGAEQGNVKAMPELRALVRLARVNLDDPQYDVGGPFDLILCRNVLIYFDDVSRRAAIGRLTEKLVPGGYFLIGHAETLHGLKTELHPILPTIYRREG